MARKTPSGDRAARVAAMRAEEARRERRWRIGIGVAATIPALALVAALVVPLATSRAAGGAAGGIAGVQTFSGLTSNHVATPVTYAQNPPVGGDHAAVWQNCGIYDTEIAPVEPAVHSLEHGAVWITYDPALPREDVAALRALARNEPYALLSPKSGLPARVVASAWGVQLTTDDPSDARLGRFLTTHLQGPQTPEPGASCFGGVGTPVA